MADQYRVLSLRHTIVLGGETYDEDDVGTEALREAVNDPANQEAVAKLTGEHVLDLEEADEGSPPTPEPEGEGEGMEVVETENPWDDVPHGEYLEDQFESPAELQGFLDGGGDPESLDHIGEARAEDLRDWNGG